ncbi:MAG: hypothetical protein C0522_07685 [Rhodocyclaceae bacterium]|jgi:OOP family OmpA-OmpF porin|nr:hypothetical protein [Rhodocyclaceae bacterium]
MKKLAAIALLTLSAAPVFAGDIYVVGSVGRSSADINKNDIDSALVSAGATGVSSSLDKNDTGYKLQLGYQFNQNFAVEGGYIDLGKATYSASFTGGSASASVKATGWNVAAVGILPINDAFSVFGKVGTIDAKVEANVSASGPGGTASGSASATKWKTLWGVGATYNISKQVGVRVEYEQFNNLGDKNTTGEADVSLVSAGVVFKF